MGAAAIDPVRWTRWAGALVTLGFAFSLFLVLAFAWLAPALLWVPPALVIGAMALAWLSGDELRLLVGILAGFVVAVGYKEGFQPEEALYGLLYLGYLAYWFVSRLFFYRDDILATRVDRALFAFLVWITGSFALTALFRGSFSTAVSELLALTMLAFYFPVKELALRRPEAYRRILGALAFVATFVVVRNLVEYRAEQAGAQHLWQIATGRVVENEHLLLMVGLIALTVALFARRPRLRWAAAGGFLLYTAGVIIGLSRAVWVSYVLGIFVIFLLVDRRRRGRLVLFGLAGLSGVMLVGYLVFPGMFALIFAGLVDRIFSLETAATGDISLVNRFLEMSAAWDHIVRNPIVGYGFGVPIKYYSLVYELTHETSFIHNGYIGVWYRHGLVGFLLLYGFYFTSMWHAVKLSRSGHTAFAPIGIAVAACLVAEALLGNTENPFATSDKVLFIGVMAGLVAAGRTVVERPGAP